MSATLVQDHSQSPFHLSPTGRVATAHMPHAAATMDFYNNNHGKDRVGLSGPPLAGSGRRGSAGVH